MTSLAEQFTAGEQAVMSELLREQTLRRYRILRRRGYMPYSAASQVKRDAAESVADELLTRGEVDFYFAEQYRLAADVQRRVAMRMGGESLSERYWASGRLAPAVQR